MRYYVPHAAQTEFHKSQATIRAICAGNQFGKTYAGCMDIIWAITKTHPHRENYIGPVFARDCCISLKIMRTVLIPTYKKIIPRKYLKDGNWSKAWSEKDNSIHFEDGSFIEFLSYEQGREAFQGPPRHIIRMDEEPSHEAIWGENLARQVTTGRNIILTFTPLNYSQWLYSKIYEGSARDDDIDMFTGHSRDNPYAREDVLASLERDIDDPAERAARLHGEFTFVAGRVYKGYGNHNLIDPFPIPDSWHKSIIIDPHPDKATAVNWIAMNPLDKKMYVYNEDDIEGDVEYICNTISAKTAGQYINLWLIDPSSRQSARIYGKGRLIDEFRKFFPALVEANNNRDIGWEAVKKAVRKDPTHGPQLMVFRNCPITDLQMRNYSWKPPLKTGESRGKPEVFKKMDDHCDNVRYRVIWRGGTKKNYNDFGNIGVYANG